VQINYFELLNNTWKRLESSDLSPSHRSLFWSIFHKWNQNYFQDFEASKSELMLMSGIKSKTTYFVILNDLIEQNYIEYTNGNGRYIKALLKVTIPNIDTVKLTIPNLSVVEIGTVNHLTVPNIDTVSSLTVPNIGQPIYNDTDLDNTDIVNTTDNIFLEKNISLKEKKEKNFSKKIENSEKPKKPKDCTFLDSEIGTIETFKFYVQNSEYPDADINFYFRSMRDWIDRKTGKPPTRSNWKLVFNTFIRNSIANSNSNDYVRSSNSSSNRDTQKLQTEFVEIDNAVDKFLTIRSRNR
jgi:hypothetical protein